MSTYTFAYFDTLIGDLGFTKTCSLEEAVMIGEELISNGCAFVYVQDCNTGELVYSYNQYGRK